MGPLYAPFYEAIEFNSSDELRGLLAQHDQPAQPDEPVINYTDNHTTWSLLHKAVEYDSLECIAVLFEHDNLNVNVKGPNRITPLFTAISKNRIKCLNMLLKHKNINVNIKNNSMMTPLHYAASIGNIECVKRLLAHPKINKNAETDDGQTPLDLARISRSNKKKDIIRLLDPNDTNDYDTDDAINQQDNDGNTLLHQAINNYDTEQVIHLLFKDNINIHIKNKEGKTPLELMMNDEAFNNNADIKKIINFSLFQSDADGLIAVHKAVKDSDIQRLKTLLQNKFVDINAPTKNGQTPLHLASQFDKSELVKVLLSKPDINVNAQDKNGETPLHYAAENGNTQCVRFLLAIPDIHIPGKITKEFEQSYPPLHIVAEYDSPEYINPLSHKPDITANAQDSSGCTPLHLAAR